LISLNCCYQIFEIEHNKAGESALKPTRSKYLASFENKGGVENKNRDA